MRDDCPFSTNLEDSHRIIQKLEAFALWGCGNNMVSFLQCLSEEIVRHFDADLVTIWDNNVYAGCQVLVASFPPRTLPGATHTISTERSLTGLAIKASDIVVHEDIRRAVEGRFFENPILIDRQKLGMMVSLPVQSLGDPDSISLVVNIAYGSSGNRHLPVSRADLGRLGETLSLCLGHVCLQQDEDTRRVVQLRIAPATGVSGLIDAIFPVIEDRTRCTAADFFLYDPDKNLLRHEASVDRYIIGELASVEPDASTQELFLPCVKELRPVALLEAYQESDGEAQEKNRIRCTTIGVPVLSTHGAPIGVLCVRGPDHESRFASSFSSFDLGALETIASSIAPALVQLIQRRYERVLLDAITRLTESSSIVTNLDSFLATAISSLAQSMRAQLGSIYLLRPDDGRLVMKAAFGPGSRLVGKASYEIGEGITGAIAAYSKPMVFRTRAEMLRHSRFEGKYDQEIWGKNVESELHNFLGVPIKSGSSLMGVLKLSNRASTATHPESYFTESDVRVVEVFCAFVAYAIEKERNIKKFRLHLEASIRALTASIEDDAIAEIMGVLEQIGFGNSLLFLYRRSSRALEGVLGCGKWAGLANGITVSLELGSALGRALDSDDGLQIFFDNDVSLAAIDRRLDESGVDGFFALPLRFQEEKIGVLVVSITGPSLEESAALLVRALASDLAVSLGTIRNRQALIESTERVMSSSRFIVSEAMAGLAVHSLHRRISEFSDGIRTQLKDHRVRDHGLVRETMSGLLGRLVELEKEMKGILEVVRAPHDEDIVINLNQEIQPILDQWHSFFRANKCRVEVRQGAPISCSIISKHSFREIVTVLLVNAVQAHAKEVTVETRNAARLALSTGDVMESAICVDVHDDGVGLSVDDPEVIFEPTYTTKSDKFGTGLGLFIARRLARQSGGDLFVDTSKRRAKGVTFRLALHAEVCP